MTHAHHVPGEVTLANIAALCLAHFIGHEALLAQTVDHLDSGDERVLLAA
jgi:hypothetical protein